MLKIAIIIGSTRPQRVGRDVAEWVYQAARQRDDAEFELIDLKDINLPLLDEPLPPAMGRYSQSHTKQWARIISGFDAFIFVTPEYNHSTSAALKNALDFLYAEWNNKVAGFVSYGSAGGTRAVEQLRLIVAELQMASVRGQVALSLFTDFQNMKTFTPADFHLKNLQQMLDQILAWGGALKSLGQNDEKGPSSAKSDPNTKSGISNGVDARH